MGAMESLWLWGAGNDSDWKEAKTKIQVNKFGSDEKSTPGTVSIHTVA